MTNKRLIYSNLLRSVFGLFAGALILLSTFAYGYGDVTFVDLEGNELKDPYGQETSYLFTSRDGETVLFPDYPVYSQENPGPWAAFREKLEPGITSWVRKDGLEDIRIMLIAPKNPFEGKAKEENYISAVYILDKDGYIIDFRAFPDTMTDPIQEKFIFNGIINFITIYVEYGKHFLWEKELPIDLQKK